MTKHDWFFVSKVVRVVREPSALEVWVVFRQINGYNLDLRFSSLRQLKKVHKQLGVLIEQFEKRGGLKCTNTSGF